MSWLRQLLAGKKCYICNQKAKEPQVYLDDKGNKVHVCFKCVSYAERRALRKP